MKQVIILNDETIITPNLCTVNHQAWYGIKQTNWNHLKTTGITDGELVKLIENADTVEDLSDKTAEKDSYIPAEMVNVILVIKNGPFETRIRKNA